MCMFISSLSLVTVHYFCFCFCIIPFNIKTTILNCHGIKSSTGRFQQILSTQFEIMVLQETWLYPVELTLLCDLCKILLVSVLGYEPADLTVHPPPPRTAEGGFIFFV